MSIKKDTPIKAPKTIVTQAKSGDEKTVSQRLAKSINIPKKGAATKTAFTFSGRLVKVKRRQIIKKSMERLKRCTWCS